MADADFYSLFMDDEQTAQEKAAALTAALRRQQAVGQLGMLTGDKVLGQFGQTQMSQAQNQQHQLSEAGRTRLEKAMQSQRMQQDQEYRQKELGIQQQQLGIHRQQLEQGKFSQGPLGVLNNRTGELEAAASSGLMSPKLAEQKWKEMTDALSTYRGRGSLNKENQERLQAAERLEALILGEGGQIQNLTPQQVREAGTALANLISKGSMSLGQIEELTPHTMAANFANLKQKLLNEPTGADAQAFLANMLETAGREKATVMKQLRSGQVQSLPNYAQLRGMNRNRYDSLLRGAGIDPGSIDDSGLELVQPPKPAAPHGPEAAGPSDRVRVQFKGKVVEIPRARLADAVKDGAVEVK